MAEELPRIERSSGKSTPVNEPDWQSVRLGRANPSGNDDRAAGLIPAEEVLAFVGAFSRPAPLEEKGEKPNEKPEKKKPERGETIALEALLGTDKKPSEYQTAFMDAYDASKALKDGKGKSPTLEAAIDRLRSCPWFGQLKVKFAKEGERADYDPTTSTITINADLPIPKQIELFVHEAYHATHVGVFALYGKDKLTEAAFLAHVRKGEMGAYEAEIKVNQELTGTMKEGSPVVFAHRTNDGKATMDLGALYKKDGFKGLDAFLWTSQPDSATEPTYEAHYKKAYKPYSDNFKGAHDAVAGWFEKDPTLKEKLEKEGY